MKESTAFVQGNVHGREEEERVRVKQPTSIVLTLVNVSSPSAKIRVNIHYIADTQLSVNFTFVCTIDQLLLSMHLVFIVIEGVTTEKEEYKCSFR